MVLAVKKGISAPAVTNIPEKWDQAWFRYFINNFLVNGDIRNAVTGPGLIITGNVSGNSTSGSTNSNVTISQAPIPNNTVMGNVSGISAVPFALSQLQLTSLVNVFTSALSGAVPASGGGAINFLRADGQFVPPVLGAVPNNTVIGNVSGGTAAPIALTQTQLTTLVNIFTATLSGAVPLSGGGTTNFLRADGTWATIVVPVGANPSALVGPSAVNGVATTFMRSDAAPAINAGAAFSWNGLHTFNSGLTVASSVFQSRGILDNATATALTLASTGAITLAAPSSNSTLTINGVNTAVALVVVSGLSGVTGGTDTSIRRAGSTANAVQQGPTLGLTDTTATTATALQHSGGQTELWQTQNNGATWNQVLKILTTRNVVINAPASSQALIVSGVAGDYTQLITAGAGAGLSFGILMRAGTNSADNAIFIQDQTGTTTFFRVAGDGTVTVSPSGANGTLVTTSAALTNNAGAAAGTLANAPAAGNPTKWIKINDNGTIRSIPAW